MVARAAKHNVPTKKAMASVLSLISFSHFGFNMLLINMSNLVFMLIFDNFSELAGIRDQAEKKEIEAMPKHRFKVPGLG